MVIYCFLRGGSEIHEYIPSDTTSILNDTCSKNPGECFFPRSPKRRRQLRHRHTGLGDHDTDKHQQFPADMFDIFKNVDFSKRQT